MVNKIPEPYRTKARALLKPWHPLFIFDLWMEDNDLIFSIELRNIMSRNEWIINHFNIRKMTGFYPLDDFSGADSYERFSLVVFRALNRFIRDLLSDKHLHAFQLAPDGCMDVLAVVKWLRMVTDPLNPWFNIHISYEFDILSLMASQPRCKLAGEDLPGWFISDVGQAVRPWHPIQPFELIHLNMREIQAECYEIAQAKGIPAAESSLRKLLYERITNALYFMRFAIPNPVGNPDGPRVEFAKHQKAEVA